MRRLDPDRVLFSHFGPSPDGARDLQQYPAIVEEWRTVALEAARENPDPDYVARQLRAHDRPGGAPDAAADHSALVSGYDLAARGFLRYFETHGFLTPGRP